MFFRIWVEKALKKVFRAKILDLQARCIPVFLYGTFSKNPMVKMTNMVIGYSVGATDQRSLQVTGHFYANLTTQVNRLF